MAQRAIPGDAAAPTSPIQAQNHRDTAHDTRATDQPLIQPESAAKSALKGEQEAPETRGNKMQSQPPAAATEAELTEPEQEKTPEMKQQQVQTPESQEALSVHSSDASLHDSDFDFLQISTEDGQPGFSLLTPSPHRRHFVGSGEIELVAGPLASPPLSSRGSSVACSPSRFFKSPCATSAKARYTDNRTVKTPQRRTIVPIRLGTPKRLLEAIDSLSQQEEKKAVPTSAATGKPEDVATKQQFFCGDAVSSARAVRKASTSSTPPRTPSPSSRQPLLSQRLKDVFDRTDDDDEREFVRGAMKSPAFTSRKTYRVDTSSSLLDADDIQCVPSGLMTSPSEHDSFFSFANSLSPLMPAEDFENSFMSVKLSPLVSLSSYDLPRLLPPFPEPEQHGNQAMSPTASVHGGTPLILKTPKNNKSKCGRGIFSAGSLAGGGLSVPGSASGFISPNLFSESFPNIQASTSATPGKDERSKLGDHSVMTMKLHTSFGTSSSLLDSHPTREIQAINNSLKRKKYIRRRKAEESRQLTKTSSSSNVQRKLLQTPVKTSASPRTRSPLHPWNGQSPRANLFKTPTPRKIAPTQKFVDESPMATPSSPPVARRLLVATAPTAAPTTPVSSKRKRKASQCVSMPSSMANISGLKMRKSPLGIRQAVALAVTPAKQIKREVTATTPGKYSMLTQQIPATSGVPSFDSSMLKTPTPVGSSTSLTISLQSASKAPLGPAIMMVSAQMPKKAPCNCKKSKCLKLYCECFASGGYCDESCNCLDCANTIATEDVRQQAIAARLEKNPNAFKPKIGATRTPGGARRLSIGASGGSRSSTGSYLSPPSQLIFQQQQQLLSSGLMTTKMHKHGCHCKKSACQKKYCECFQAGVPCGENCRCIDCKNQAPCVAHASGVGTASSAVGGTPSRIANELEEAFVSPVLQGVRQRLRIDRETWKKNFSSPFEASPGRERERTERFQSRLLASTGAGATGGAPLSVRVRAVPFTSPRTPHVMTRVGAKRSRGLSPIRGQGDEQRGSNSGAAPNVRLVKEREVQQFGFADKTSSSVVMAALSAVVQSSVGAERVFVLPLFGANLPPLESGVSANIFRFLTNADLHNASLVSHLWNQVALGDTVWDHANFIPTEANVAAARRSRKKMKLETPIKRELSEKNGQVGVIRHEPNLAVLSALR